MNVMKVQTPIEPKSQKMETGARDGETFSDKLSAVMKGNNRKEKPEASKNLKAEEDTLVDNPMAKEDLEEEKDPVGKKNLMDKILAVPFNLVTETVKNKTVSVEESEIPVDGLAPASVKNPEISAVMKSINLAETETGKISEPKIQALAAEADAIPIQETLPVKDGEAKEVPKDVLSELSNAAENKEAAKGTGEVKPALLNETHETVLKDILSEQVKEAEKTDTPKIIGEAKPSLMDETHEMIPKDILSELSKVSEKMDSSKVTGEFKPALMDEITDETKERGIESRGKDGRKDQNESILRNAEEAVTVKDPRAAEKMIIPQTLEKSSDLEKNTVKPESEGVLKADENIAQMQVEKTSETVKASPIRESIPKNEFNQNLEKATDEIMRSMETMRDGDKTTMKLKLHPEELGKMEITLVFEEGKLSGKILLDNHEARQLFSQRIDELNETLSKNSVQVAKFEVGIGEKQAGNQARQDSQRHMQAQNPFKGYIGQRKDETVYQSTVTRTLAGIDLFA